MAEMWQEERRMAQRERRTLFALLRRDIINFSMCHPKRPVQLEDLLPSEPGSGGRRPKRMTPRRRKVIADNIRNTMSHFLPKEE